MSAGCFGRWDSRWRCWEEIVSPTSKTGAEGGWLECLACSILGHLPSACLDHTARIPAGYGPGTLMGSTALSLGVPHFPWPMSARGCRMTQPSMAHFGCWGERRLRSHPYSNSQKIGGTTTIYTWRVSHDQSFLPSRTSLIPLHDQDLPLPWW